MSRDPLYLVLGLIFCVVIAFAAGLIILVNEQNADRAFTRACAAVGGISLLSTRELGDLCIDGGAIINIEVEP